jgi:hypothetical protein
MKIGEITADIRGPREARVLRRLSRIGDRLRSLRLPVIRYALPSQIRAEQH